LRAKPNCIFTIHQSNIFKNITRKAKILTTLEQDIEKFRIATDLDLFVKLKFLKFLTSALIFYGPADAISLIEKTITTFAELKKVLF